MDRRDASDASCVGNVLWLVLARWWLARHITAGLALCITIIGIPLGIANFKLVPVSLMPFGKEIVPHRPALHRALTAQPCPPRLRLGCQDQETGRFRA